MAVKKVLKLQVKMTSGTIYSGHSTEKNRAEYFAYAMEEFKKDIKDIESITVTELKNFDMVLNRRGKKTHITDDSGEKTLCGELINYDEIIYGGTRFRCDKCDKAK